MREAIKKHSIPAWYLGTLILTGGLFCLHLIWKDAGKYSISFTQFGPMFATFLLIYITNDKNALFRVQNGLLIHVRDIVWLVLTAVTPFAFIGFSSLFLSALYNSPYSVWSGNSMFYTINFVAILLGSICEEIGWRGYLLPALDKRFHTFYSSIIVGCLWGFWHLNYVGDIVFWLLFIVTTVELSIIITFFLHMTDGSIWTAVVFHTFFNLANRVFVWERFNTYLLIILIIILGLFCIIIVAADKNKMLNFEHSEKRIA